MVKKKITLEKLVSLPFQGLGMPSSDGRKMAFASNKTGNLELHVIDIETREIQQVSQGNYAETYGDWHRWSHDDTFLVFPRDLDPGREKYDIFKITYPDGVVTHLTKTPESHDAGIKPSPTGKYIVFHSDRSGTTQLHRMDDDGSNVKQLTHSEGHVLAVSVFGMGDHHWSSDGQWLVYSKINVETPQVYDIWKIDVDGIEETKINVTEKPAQNIANYLSNDGSMILFTSDIHGIERVGVHTIETETTRWFGKGVHTEQGLRITDDGKQVIVSKLVDAESKIITYDINTGVEKGLKIPPGFAGSGKTALDGRHLIIGHQDSTHRMQFLLYDLDRDSFDVLLPAIYHDFNPEEDFNPDEYISYKSDDVEIYSILYKPKDIQPGIKLPALVAPHGGPTGQYWRLFYSEMQVLADRGFVVLMPNVRGSTGYGNEFRDACLMDWGGTDLDDIERGAEYLKTLDYVDPDRIGVYGISYGGYMTYMAMTKKPHLWKAGVAIHGITHLKTLYEESIKNYPPLAAYWEQQMGKDTDENLALWEDRSAVNFADQMTGKFQMIHAENDPRCGISHAKMFREKLLELGRKEGEDFEYVVLKDQGHFTDSIEQRLEYYRYLLDFLERNL